MTLLWDYHINNPKKFLEVRLKSDGSKYIVCQVIASGAIVSLMRMTPSIEDQIATQSLKGTLEEVGLVKETDTPLFPDMPVDGYRFFEYYERIDGKTHFEDEWYESNPFSSEKKELLALSAKGSYKSKDGIIKECIKIKDRYYIPKNDI